VELLTGSEADRRARAVAARLRSAGLRPGDRAALAVPGILIKRMGSDDAARLQAATAVTALGAMRLGVVPVLVNPDLGAEERAHVLADSRPSLVVSSPLTMASLADPEGAPARPDLPDVPRARPMIYTSGTTGPAKGVWTAMLPEPAIERWWRDEIEQWPHDETDVSLVHGPVAHFGPLRFAVLAWLGGGSVVFPGRFDAGRTAQIMARVRPTTAFLVPGHLQRLFALPGGPPPSTYRRLVHAGAPCPEPLKRAVHSWAGAHRVWEFYGSTEGQFTACQGTEWEDRPGTVGRARPGRELLIDDGVIWCRSPEYCRFEYFGDPERTKAAWREDPDLPTDSPGNRLADPNESQAAFTVGDLGRLDSGGYLWLEGRREDLIISGGVNVYPAQVESVLGRLAGVEQVAVFGLPDENWGQRVCVAYVGSATPDDVDRWARTRLAKFQVPKSIHQVGELPMTVSGKVRRLDLADSISG